MPIINNTETIVTQPFSRMWIRNIAIIFDNPNYTQGTINATLLPYDGENLLFKAVTVKKSFNSKTQDLLEAMQSITSEVSRLSGVENKIKTISVLGVDPSSKVSATVIFKNADSRPFRINDCFELAQEDEQFAAVFLSTMAVVAELAGFTFTP